MLLSFMRPSLSSPSVQLVFEPSAARPHPTTPLHFVPFWCTHGTYDCATVQEDLVFVQDAGAPETDPLALGELDRIAREAEERELAARTSGLKVAELHPSPSPSPHAGQTGKSYEFRNGSAALELVVRRDSCTPQYRRRWRSDATFPFDRYDLSFLVSASKPAPSDIQIPVVAAYIYNHVLESHWWFVVSYAPLDLSPSLVAQKVEPFESEEKVQERAPQLDVKIRVRRHPSTVLSAVTVFVVNWLTTVVALWLTSNTHPHQSQPDISSIVIPALVTIFVCVLRNLMPAAPPLGCVLDLVGIIPIVVLLLSSTAYRLYARLTQSRSRRELYGMNPAKFDDA
ncbi:hypothetical protein BKA62DRAFT_507392 [Auriculariales sp. MPI-PUGE-AT-0066]|nr:hypothetical protein BKA62DRAFT_507392 [Auriculariales sp. MPI-PUGE-AT-0066]